MRTFLARSFVASMLTLAAIPSQAHAAETTDNIVVMISVDGLAGFYYNDPAAEMPTIRALGTAGVAAPLMKAVTPTVTWPPSSSFPTTASPPSPTPFAPTSPSATPA